MYWQKMFDITTERVMEMEALVKQYEAGRKIRFPIYVIRSNLQAARYLHSLSYLNIKELQ